MHFNLNDIAVPPKELRCLPDKKGLDDGRATVGYRDYKILCYATMHPMGTVKWTIPGGKEVGRGININTTVRKDKRSFIYYLLGGEASKRKL